MSSRLPCKENRVHLDITAPPTWRAPTPSRNRPTDRIWVHQATKQGSPCGWADRQEARGALLLSCDPHTRKSSKETIRFACRHLAQTHCGPCHAPLSRDQPGYGSHLLQAKMCVDRRVPCRARQALAGSVRDVHASLRVHIPLAETKVNQVDLKTGIGGSHEESFKAKSQPGRPCSVLREIACGSVSAFRTSQ